MTMRAFIITFALFAISCGSDSSSRRSASEFDGSAAYRYLIAQCDLGPRVPNTPAHRQALALIARTFDSLEIAVEKQNFRIKDPYSSDTLRLTNVIGRFNPDKSNRLLFCAHWDSRPRSEMDADSQKQTQPLPGANDGASGVAVLLQLAKELAALHVARGVDLVFLDGEDWGKSGDLDYYCLGAKEFARRADAKVYDYGVVLDMVGDKDQRFFKEEYSVRYEGKLVDKVWARAAHLGMSTSFDTRVSQPIYDDHLPLLAASIRTIDIIDFEYPWWHTTQDTPDKCSPESLGRIGKLVLSLVVDPL
ncbi:MAG: M28 family peptidase [candidate division Zixibacteria bacterium]|nr:M28 family peptidase [candidate division Zixibacteria bacterium]